MSAFVFNPDVPELEQENQLICYLRDNFVDNRKKIVKLVRGVDHQLNDFLRKNLATSIVHAKDPVKYVQNAIREMNDLTMIIDALIADGNHGMLMLGQEIHGVAVNANPRWLRVNDRWNPEDEQDIRYDIIVRYMQKHGRYSMEGRIHMFHQFGFSGSARYFKETFTEEYYAELKLERKNDASDAALIALLENG